MRRLIRAEDAFETCKDHLTKTSAFNTEIDVILTSYVTATVYASFELEARRLVGERGSLGRADDHLAAFTRYAAERLMRSIKIGELAGAAGWFDASCKKAFHDQLSDEEKSAWDTICTNRHGLAHNDGDTSGATSGNLTFADLEALYPKALKVLDALEASLIPAADNMSA